jgi:uncharacterized protein (DUF433 family)
MIPAELKDILVSTPDTLSGDVRFAGTRVPVRCLLDSLMHGRSVDGFLAGYPNVTREQAMAVIRWQQDISRSALGVEMADALARAS